MKILDVEVKFVDIAKNAKGEDTLSDFFIDIIRTK